LYYGGTQQELVDRRGMVYRDAVGEIYQAVGELYRRDIRKGEFSRQ
jgi:hypothetical protein